MLSSEGAPAETWTPRRYLAVLAGLALFLGPLLYLLQPSQPYPGDAAVVRAEARYLVAHGTWGVPVGAPGMEMFVPPAAHPGQYFHLHEARGRYFSRWGLAATVLFAPPLMLGVPAWTNQELEVLNLYNILWALLACAGLLRLVARHTSSVVVATMAVLGVLCGSYVFTYLRAQTSELPQMTLAIWSAALFQEVRADLVGSGRYRRRTRLLLAVMLSLLSVLFWIKFYFVPWLLAAPLLLCWSARADRSWLPSDVTRPLLRDALLLIALAIAARGVMGWYAFGDPFATGVGAITAATEETYVSFRYLPRSLASYAWGADGSLLLHLPLLALLPWGLKPMWTRSAPEVLFGLVGILVVMFTGAMVENHLGAWSHGPRFFVPVVAWLAAPVACALEQARSSVAPRRALMHLAAAALIALGVWLEEPLVRFPPFAWYYLHGLFHAGPQLHDVPEAYWTDVPQSLALRGFQPVCNGDAEGPLGAGLVQMQQRATPEVQVFMRGQLARVCRSGTLLLEGLRTSSP
ncbi:MAG: hypothetical protein AB2A00_09060 [Myxococcota bacterium]